jgi:hypothetical protein
MRLRSSGAGGVHEPRAEQSWFISGVLHQAFVKVNVEGTEAAASASMHGQCGGGQCAHDGECGKASQHSGHRQNAPVQKNRCNENPDAEREQKTIVDTLAGS